MKEATHSQPAPPAVRAMQMTHRMAASLKSAARTFLYSDTDLLFNGEKRFSVCRPETE